MNEKEWDKRLLDFLKRTGEEIKAETQRLVEEVRDPATQRKMKESLRDFGSWAKQTAEEAAQMMENAIKKAETALSQKIERSSTATHTQAPTGGDARTTSSAPPTARSAASGGPQGQSAKVGKGKRSSARKGRTGEASKTIGRKK
jgi:hypothetical protein